MSETKQGSPDDSDGDRNREPRLSSGSLLVLVVAALFVLAGVYIFLKSGTSVREEASSSKTPAPNEEKQTPTGEGDQAATPDSPAPVASRPTFTSASGEEIIVLDIARSARQLHDENVEPQEELMIIQNLLAYYRRVEGANPQGGLNSEIVAKLIGNNDRKVALISPGHPAINAEGELVDRWGTPYWFHPVSRELMEIISAGPDRELFTDDDVRGEELSDE